MRNIIRKSLFLLYFLVLNTFANTQTLVKYDYMETWDWAGYWNTPVNTGWYTNVSVSSNQSAVILGGGNSSSSIEDNWYRLPNINGLDATKQYQFRFRLSSHSFNNPTAATRGVDGPDYVSVQVSRNGSAYTNELRITGNANATWPYNVSGNITHTANGVFSTINAPTGDVYPSGAGILTNGPSVISLNIPINTTQLAVDLYCRVNSAGEEWWIDNIELWDITPIALPIELMSFSVIEEQDYNLLKWSTASENNNDYFLLERSEDGSNWVNINSTDGMENSNTKMNYLFRDFTFTNTLNYYRLSQVDFNGVSETFNIISIDNSKKQKQVLKVINILGQEVSQDTKGLLIIKYTDGTSVKIIN